MFWPRLAACGILVPWPEIEPVPPTLEAWSLNHWTTREVPMKIFKAIFHIVSLHIYSGTILDCLIYHWMLWIFSSLKSLIFISLYPQDSKCFSCTFLPLVLPFLLIGYPLIFTLFFSSIEGLIFYLWIHKSVLYSMDINILSCWLKISSQFVCVLDWNQNYHKIVL